MTLNKTEYEIGVKDVTQHGIASVQANLSRLSHSFETLIPAATIGGLVAFVKSTANTADELGKLAQKIGIGVTDLSKLTYAAKLADVEQETLSAGIRILSKSISEAAQGSKEYADTFRILGIELKKNDGTIRSTNDVLLDLADTFESMPDGATKTALAMKLFGRSGSELIPLLNEGAKGLRAMGKEAENMGLVIDQKAAEQAERLNDSLTRLQGASTGLWRSMALAVIPGLAAVAESMAKAAAEGKGLIGVLKAIPSGVADAAYGTDQERLKKLELDEKDTVDRIQKIRDLLNSGGSRTDRKMQFQFLVDASMSLAKIRREMEGLKVVIPEDNGAADKNRNIEKLLDTYGLIEAADKKLESARDASASKLAQQQADAIARMEKQLALGESATELARTQYELEKGSFSGFDESAKAKIEGLAKQLDAQRLINEANKENEAIQSKRLDDQKSAVASLEDLIAREQNLTSVEKIRYEIERGRYAEFDETTKNQLVGLARLADAYAQLNAENKTLDDQVKENAKKAADAVKELGLAFSSAFEDAIVNGKGVGDMLKGLEQDILRIATRKLITEPLAGGISDFLGSMLGSFGGARASGGPVSAGKAYLVGERGPEMFVPKQSGEIRASSAVGATFVQNVYGVTDVNAFRRARSQMQTDAHAMMTRSAMRNG